MAAGLQPDRAVIVEPEPDGVSALGEIEGFDRMTGCGPCPAVCEQGTDDRSGWLLRVIGDFLHRFLQHFLRDSSTLERIGEAACRVLVELSLVTPQPLTDVAF